MTAASLTWRDVWARRLTRHSLLDLAPAERMVDVAGAVCGIHAQVMSAAELSIGARVDGITRQDVRSALWEKRTLVKTVGLRGTVHLFPSGELPMWMAAMRARSALDPMLHRSLDMDEHELKSVLEAITAALDGERLTMKQLGEHVVARVGTWAGEATEGWSGTLPRWRKALGEAAHSGLLCYGPPQGNEVTFVRTDLWLGAMRDVDPDNALAEVFRRYLRAYGPATPGDFARWFNIPPAAARDLAERLDGELEEVDIEGYRSHVLADEIEDAGHAVEMPLRLLPHFDVYVIGCHPRDRLLPPDWAQRVPPRTIPSTLQVLLLDGTVAGVWDRKARGKRVEVTVEPFGKLDRRQERMLEEEAARVGALVQAEAELQIGTITMRPHL
jgi:hypothetical protein